MPFVKPTGNVMYPIPGNLDRVSMYLTFERVMYVCMISQTQTNMQCNKAKERYALRLRPPLPITNATLRLSPCMLEES